MSQDLRLGHLRGIVMRAPNIVATTGFYLDQWGLHVAHEAPIDPGKTRSLLRCLARA